MVAVWDFTSFWQFDIYFAHCLIIMHRLDNINIKHIRMSVLTLFFESMLFVKFTQAHAAFGPGDSPSPLMAFFLCPQLRRS